MIIILKMMLKKVLFLSIFSTSSQRLVSMCFPGSLLQLSHDSVACRVFLHAALFMPQGFFSQFSSSFLSLWFFLHCMMVACMFLFCVGAYAGLCWHSSHGGVSQSRGWLPKVEALVCSRHPTSILVM